MNNPKQQNQQIRKNFINEPNTLMTTPSGFDIPKLRNFQQKSEN